MASQFGPGQVVEDTYLGEVDPGMGQTAAAVTAALAATAVANRESQQQCARFIMESGADVVGGHSPVNSPSGAFLKAGSGALDDAGVD